MKQFLLTLALFVSTLGYGQMKIDTTRTSVTVKNLVAGTPKTLSIFRTMVPGQGLRYLAVYQPSMAELGEEPEISKTQFTDETANIKAMLDAALSRKPLNMSRFSINMMAYLDFTSKLIETYANSKEWNDYLKANADKLRVPITLWDGSEIQEIAYDQKVALSVFEKSTLLTDLKNFFAPYGYTVTPGGFPDEHQQIVSTDKLMLLHKDPNLFIPTPSTFVNLVKIKK